MKKFWKEKLKKVFIISVILCVISECFIFNYKTFVGIIGKAPVETYTVEQATIDGLEKSGTSYIATTSNPTITFNIENKVNTMRFDLWRNSDLYKETVVDISFLEQGNSESYRNSQKQFHILSGDERTRYVTCNYSQKLYSVKLTIECETGDNINITGLTINETIPFDFSVVRFLCLLLFINMVYILFKYPAYNKPYQKNCTSHICGKVAVIALLIIIQLIITYMYVGNFELFENTSGNQMTQELVDAFEHGQVSLLDKVPEQLLNLENPYDLSQRTNAGVDYKWDHLLYEGKYYSYYGIGPVITLFLPYHMITGYYFSTPLAVLLFNLIGTLFLCMTFLSVISNWFKKVPYNLVLMGMFLTVIGSGIIINLLCPQFYEIAQASGFCFTVIGFYFMVNSGIFQNKTINKLKLFWSAFFMSLAVLSRAVSALYAVVLVIWIIYGWFQNNKSKGKSVKETLCYLTMVLAPYVVFGLIQMAYNYARFGSILDFGIEYSLTINDFTSTQISLSTVMVSIVNFFFTLPIINSTYPFVHSNMDYLNTNGYYFVATQNAMGIIPRTLPILSFLYTPKLAKRFNRREKIKLSLIWLLPGLIFPIIIAAVSWESGFSLRYICDFAWQMTLASLVLIFYVYQRINQDVIKKWLLRLMFVSTVWCAVSMIAIAIYNVPTVDIGVYNNREQPCGTICVT
jgi:hypothetical protein